MAKKGSFYKMKGHTLPGINQRSDDHPKNVAEQGLSGSSAFQRGIGDYEGEGKFSMAKQTGVLDSISSIDRARDQGGRTAFYQDEKTSGKGKKEGTKVHGMYGQTNSDKTQVVDETGNWVGVNTAKGKNIMSKSEKK